MSQGMGKTEKSKIINFQKVRKQKIEERRQNTERVFFKSVLGVYCVTEGDEIREVEIIDLSDKGCAFKVPFSKDNPWPRTLEEVPLRLYFSQDTYLMIPIKIKNATPFIDGGVRYVRYGCTIDTTSSAYRAYKAFVRFIKEYSKNAKEDKGNASFFYI